MNKTRFAIAASVSALLVPLLTTLPATASLGSFGQPTRGTVTGTTVRPFDSPTVAPSGHAPMAAKLAAAGGVATPATTSIGHTTNSRVQAPVNTTNEEQILKAFPAYTRADGPAGNPPDVSVAASTTQIMQVNNFAVRVFNRAGTKTIDVTTPTFLTQDATFTVGDPQVAYDPATGRWFVSAAEFNSGFTGGKVLLMVSGASTLTGTTPWKRYVLADTASVLDDQPKLGLTSDKVLVAWERFNSGTTFAGPSAFVADKAEAVNFATTLDTASIGGGTNDFGLAPANNLSPGTTGYFVETGSPGSTLLTILQATGAPSTSPGTFFSVSQQTMNSPTASPPAADSASTAGRIQTGDTRIANAVWRNGVLSFVAGQGCLPFGSSGSTPTACVRLWRVATPSLSIAEDSTLGLNGGFIYDPAITYSNNGDLHLVVTLSVGGLFAPSMLVLGRPAGAGAWGAFSFVTEEFGEYTGIDSIPYRWGDFNSIVPDPLNPSDAFAAAESTDGATSSAPNFQIVVARIGIPLNTLTLTRSRTSITYGGSVTVTGKLTRPGGQPLAGEPVQLWRKLAPATSFTDYKNLTTNASGVVSVSDRPLTNAQYEWIYPSHEVDNLVDTFLEFTLATQSVAVSEPVMVSVRGTENHTSIVHGGTVKFSFLVAPNEHGRLIYLQRFIGGRWRNVTSHALSSTSAWTFTQTLATAGTYLFRGLQLGDATHAAGTSATLKVKAT